MARTDFTDLQKAEIYARDLAMCSFSGKSLWLLDEGASGFYMIDWADHIVPVSRGGASTVENGVCASWLYNYNKAANVGANIYLFRLGLPTLDYFAIYNVVPPELSQHWRRFSKIHISDWFFNRAVWHLMLGVIWLDNSNKEVVKKRDNIYRAKASYKLLKTWRKLSVEQNARSLEERNLVPENLYKDHSLLLGIREVECHESLLDTMSLLLPYYKANIQAFNSFRQLYADAVLYGYNSTLAQAFIKSLNKKNITPLMRRRLTTNVENLLIHL